MKFVRIGMEEKGRKGCEVIEIEPKLEMFYKEMDCSCITMEECNIGGKIYDLVADDEGLFKYPAYVHGRTDGEPSHVGTLLIGGTADCNGNQTDLTEGDIAHILRHVKSVMYPASDGAMPKFGAIAMFFLHYININV